MLTIVNELDLLASENSKKPLLVELITKSDSYNEEMVKNLLIGIISEMEELEKKFQLEEAEKHTYELKNFELEIA